MDLRRLPELFCGFQRRRGRGPTLYPVACSPQAWASATPFSLIEASLGLEFDPEHGEMRLRNPRLPPFLDEMTLRNLRLGDASVDIKSSPASRRGLAGYLALARNNADFRRVFALTAAACRAFSRNTPDSSRGPLREQRLAVQVDVGAAGRGKVSCTDIFTKRTASFISLSTV